MVSINITACRIITALRLSQRSINTPEGSAKKNTGTVTAKPISPRSNGLPLMRYASSG
ncbi:MAG: hypothetical protein U0X93_09370 [Anaerolineales bacterium]